LEQGFIFV